jgi:hypothetical protein
MGGVLLCDGLADDVVVVVVVERRLRSRTYLSGVWVDLQGDAYKLHLELCLTSQPLRELSV